MLIMKLLQHLLAPLAHQLGFLKLFVSACELLALRHLRNEVLLLIAFLAQGLLANDFIPVMNFLELSQLFVKVDNLLKLFSALHRHGLRFSVGFEHLDPVLNLLDLIEQDLPLQRGLLPPLCLLVRCLGLDLLEVRALSRGRGSLG